MTYAKTTQANQHALACLVLLSVGFAQTAHAQYEVVGVRPTIPAGTRSMTEGVGVDEHLLAQVPLDGSFTTADGARTTLASIIDGSKPVVLNLVYHQCPSLCSMVLEGLTTSLVQQTWTVGQQFDVITLSIDPRDGPQEARNARVRAFSRYPRSEARTGWHFLVGTAAEVARVAEAVGFRFRWDEATQQFSHPGVIMVLTRAGKVARYLYGISYPPQDLRLGLLEASEGRSINTIERLLVYCYRYDQHNSRYVVIAWRIMKIGGFLYAAILIAGLAWFWRRERRLSAAAAVSPPQS